MFKFEQIFLMKHFVLCSVLKICLETDHLWLHPPDIMSTNNLLKNMAELKNRSRSHFLRMMKNKT